ncbi:MAG: sugar ABC transporter substrate-binding protein, partial [Lachnospiraceae bacterium]|nr:sugar ABC transporter substrate-binding protein [Lachnospiraceae bacterium]
MHTKILRTATVIILAVVVYLGSFASIKNINMKGHEPIFSKDKETLYFWYTDDSLTDYINACA